MIHFYFKVYNVTNCSISPGLQVQTKGLEQVVCSKTANSQNEEDHNDTQNGNSFTDILLIDEFITVNTR